MRRKKTYYRYFLIKKPTPGNLPMRGLVSVVEMDNGIGIADYDRPLTLEELEKYRMIEVENES